MKNNHVHEVFALLFCFLNYNILESEFSEINLSFVDGVRKLWPGLAGAKKMGGQGATEINYPEKNSSAIVIEPAFLPSLPLSFRPSLLPIICIKSSKAGSTMLKHRYMYECACSQKQ